MPSKMFYVALLLLMVVGITPAIIYIPGVPVDQMTLYQLQAACNILQNDLANNPTLPRSMAFRFYSSTYLANYFLQKVANDPGIASYNNILVGAGNAVAGNKNIIFGNSNSVYGSNNYIFSQNFNSSAVSSGSISNNLVLDDWVIQLLKMYLIPFGPSQAIDNWTY